MKFSQVVGLAVATATPIALAADIIPTMPADGLSSIISTKTGHASFSHVTHTQGRPTGTKEHPHPTATAHHHRHNGTETKSGFKTHTKHDDCSEEPWLTKTAHPEPLASASGKPGRDHARRWLGGLLGRDEAESLTVTIPGAGPTGHPTGHASGHHSGHASGHAHPTGGKGGCHLHPHPPHHSGESGFPVGTGKPTKPTGTKKVIGPIRPTLSHGSGPVPTGERSVPPFEPLEPGRPGPSGSTVAVSTATGAVKPFQPIEPAHPTLPHVSPKASTATPPVPSGTAVVPNPGGPMIPAQ